MNGEGFVAHVKEGDKVRIGDKLITFDLELVKEKAASAITPIVITNGDVVETLEKLNEVKVKKGATALLQTELKS